MTTVSKKGCWCSRFGSRNNSISRFEAGTRDLNTKFEGYRDTGGIPKFIASRVMRQYASRDDN